MATTNFREWLDLLDDHDIEEIECLYESIRQVTEIGSFKTQENNGRLFVTTIDHEETLMLASPQSVDTFLAILDKEYSGDFGWVGGYANYVKAMRKDD